MKTPTTLPLLFASAASLLLALSANASSMTDLSGPDWKLWRDTEAKWADHELFLPPADLTKLPVNIPTGGWDKLAAPEAIPMQISASAEEYFGDGTDPNVPLTENYSIRWEGKIIPTATGGYTINVQVNQIMCLWLDGKIISQKDKVGGTRDKIAKLTLTAGQPLAIKLEYANRTSRGDIRLKWLPPVQNAVSPEMILDRARRDGTSVILLERADTWAEALQTATGIPQGKPFKMGGNWIGGQFFVKKYPLFAELPTDQALDWPYQAVITGSRVGLDPSAANSSMEPTTPGPSA